MEDAGEAFEAGPPQRFELVQKFVGAAQLVDLAAHELFPSAPVLGDQTGDDQDLDVLLHRGEADRIQPAELADGALTVECLRDDVAPCCIAEREEQPVGLFRALAEFLQPYGCRIAPSADDVNLCVYQSCAASSSAASGSSVAMSSSSSSGSRLS